MPYIFFKYPKPHLSDLWLNIEDHMLLYLCSTLFLSDMKENFLCFLHTAHISKVILVIPLKITTAVRGLYGIHVSAWSLYARCPS